MASTRMRGLASGADGLVCDPTFSVWGRCKPQRVPRFRGRARRQTHFGTNLLKNNLKSALFSVAVYTPNSYPISDVHWLVRCKIGSAVHGCEKNVLISRHRE